MSIREELIYTLILNVVIVLIILSKKKNPVGSDHAVHVSLIDRIKLNNHRFLTDYSISPNDKHAWYPQLFHWCLSFFSEKLYKEKYIYINVVVKIIEIIAFNFFLYCLSRKIEFPPLFFIYSNLIVNVFPFSYAIWNAKNTGLSARGIGVVVGQIYTYLIVLYVLTENLWFLPIISIAIFIIMLLSIMTMQYVLLSLPFFVLFFNIPELLLIPIIAVVFFYLTMPKVAINSIKGQYNHKRNYALYYSEYFILKYRPSIYRDFFYDFWIIAKKDLKKGLVYMYKNPIVEIIYGLPFLWFVVYTGFKFTYVAVAEQQVLFKVILACLAVFVLTSFRWTRFLGEPQRYLEYSIPLITILYVFNFSITLHVILFFCCVLFINITALTIRTHKANKNQDIAKNSMLARLEKDKIFAEKIVISNDNELAKFISGIGIVTIRPDPLADINHENEYLRNFYQNDLYILSPFALSEYYNKYKPDVLIINTDLYSLETLTLTLKFSKLGFVEKLDCYEIYTL